MRTLAVRSRVLLFAFIAAATVAVNCDKLPFNPSPTPTPSPSPAPAPGAANIVVENFTATYTQGSNGAYNYRVSLRLHETAGVSATLNAVTLTLTQTGGGTAASNFTPAEAFGTSAIGANATLPSNVVTFSSPPIAAQSLAVRVTFTDAKGNSGAATGTTNVTAG